MRVLHLVKTSQGATWALKQMRELVRLGVDVHVIMPPGGALFSKYVQAGVTVHPGNVDFSLRSLSRRRLASSMMRQLVAEIQPTIIHSHFVGTTITMRMALGRNHPTPRVFQVPGPLHLEHWAFRRAELVTAGTRDYWVGSCEWTCNTYKREGVEASKVFLSYYATDVDAFQRRSPGRLRKEIELDEDVPIVGMVAYMYAPKRFLGQRRGLKGHEDLIDALVIVAKARPSVRAVIVGGAWGGAYAYEAKLRQYAATRLPGRVVFLGTRSDVPDLYPDFDVVVHPSHSENVGGAAESLLMAVPTIATNVGGFPDVVIPNQTGWLVPPKNPRALADAILEALSDSAQASRMARQGELRVRRMFDVQNTAREILGIYETIASRHQDPGAEIA